jgi:hypothetical protein
MAAMEEETLEVMIAEESESLVVRLTFPICCERVF